MAPSVHVNRRCRNAVLPLVLMHFSKDPAQYSLAHGALHTGDATTDTGMFPVRQPGSRSLIQRTTLGRVLSAKTISIKGTLLSLT